MKKNRQQSWKYYYQARTQACEVKGQSRNSTDSWNEWEQKRVADVWTDRPRDGSCEKAFVLDHFQSDPSFSLFFFFSLLFAPSRRVYLCPSYSFFSSTVDWYAQSSLPRRFLFKPSFSTSASLFLFFRKILYPCLPYALHSTFNLIGIKAFSFSLCPSQSEQTILEPTNTSNTCR